MTTPDHILIVFNPKAGAVDRIELLHSLCNRLVGLGFFVQLISDLNELEHRAAELCRAGRLRLIVSAGGDGTLSAIAERTTSDTCLAVFPLGTENLMAKWLGATTDLELFAAAVATHRTRTIDAALANGRLALITIGVGFDAEVVREVHSKRTGHITKWSYAWPIWRTFWRYRFPKFKIQLDGWRPRSSTSSEVAELEQSQSKHWVAPWVFVANLPLYAGGLSLIPSAEPSDGVLDIASLRGSGRIRGLWYALWIALRRHVHLSDFTAFQAEKIRIESSRPVGYQIDGDFGGELPLEIRVQKNRIKLLAFDHHIHPRIDCKNVSPGSAVSSN
jgi:diacylglycerol kinase (ATP)